MDLNFNKVSYDGELADFSEDELQKLVGEFEDAQESNVAEFEKAAETLDEVDEADIEEFNDARETLIEEITGAEQFESVPLSEDSLQDADFGELREWREFVSDDAAEESEESGKDFDDMGKEAPTHEDNEDADKEFAEEAGLADMSGVVIE